MSEQEPQYIGFECEVLDVTDEYITILYTRIDEHDPEGTEFKKAATFSTYLIGNLDEVEIGYGLVQIEHAALTDELLTYDETKEPVSE